MSEIRMKKDVSLAITARHMYHYYDRVIKYQLRKNIADIEIKDGTKSKEYQEEVLNEYIPKALKTIKVLEEVGASGRLSDSDIDVKIFFKKKDLDILTIIRNIYQTVKEIDTKDFNGSNVEDDIATYNRYIDTLIKLAGSSMENEIGESLNKRDTRLQELQHSDNLSDWNSVFRQDWTYKNLYLEYGQAIAKQHALVFYESGGLDVSDDEYERKIEDVSIEILEEIINDGYAVFDKMVEKNEGLEILRAAYLKMMDNKGLNNIFKHTNNTFQEVEKDYD